MASKHSRTEAELSSGADNFRLIRGIGPGVANRLHSAGILSFAQLAALSPNDIAALVAGLAGLSAERIAAQDWIGQARELASKPANAPRDEATTPVDRQHYATFAVELLMDEGNDVRRTRITHVQGGDEEIWAGWEGARLMEFFVQRAGLRAPARQMILPASTAPQLASELAAAPEPAPDAAAPLVFPPQPAVTAEAVHDEREAGLSGVLRLLDLEAIRADSSILRNILRHGIPFDVRLTLDLTNVVALRDEPLAYTATIYSRQLGGGARLIVGESRGTITPTDSVTVDVEGISLAPGVYKLEATAALAPLADAPSARPGLSALIESRPMQVC